MMPCVFVTIGNHQTYQATVSVAVPSPQIMHSPARQVVFHLKTVLVLTSAHKVFGVIVTNAFFFNVRVFHPNAPSYRNMQLPSAYRLHERQKQRSYDQRIREVEHGSFTPRVFSTSGGMGKCASVTYKRIATLLSTKREQTYGATIAWIRCCISFSLLHSAIMCLRGARSSQGRPFTHSAIDLAVAEAKVPTFV